MYLVHSVRPSTTFSLACDINDLNSQIFQVYFLFQIINFFVQRFISGGDRFVYFDALVVILYPLVPPSAPTVTEEDM